MRITLIPRPPEQPPTSWLCGFAEAMTALQPEVSAQGARRSALLAFPGTWLLDPEEAAMLWISATEAALRELRQGGRSTGH